MRKLFLTLGAALALTASAQVKLIHPTPQQVQRKGELVDMPANYKIIRGTVHDKVGKKYRKLVPNRAEAYYLQVTPTQAVVIGADATGLAYGLQSLQQLSAKGKLEPCIITDYPDVPFRGVVEGFYGTPWSHDARLSQIAFYGRHKMNVYIYGPKDDPYHSVPNWRKPYPEKEAAQLQELVKASRANNVHFYWAVHPGQDIKWNDEDRQNLLQKFEAMYQLGVRAYAIFFDDIWGEGTKADKQAALLNFLNRQFVEKKKDVAPLIICPTEYNKGWANDKGGYLRTLGDSLDRSVQIMWTGNSVVHTIDKPSMEWINQRIKRPAYIWWNFPVTDYCRDHLMIGPVYGNGLDIASDVSGFLSNPMEHAEASKIALYGVAEYTWNMKQYNAEKQWQAALRELLPSDAHALRLFAQFNEDAGANGHQFRRDEGVKFAEQLAKATTKPDSLRYLQTLSNRLATASNALLANTENPRLIAELRPWLLQAKLVAEYGRTVSAMQPKARDFMTTYKAARSIRKQMFDLDNSDVRHAQMPGIKVGSKWFVPTIDALFAQAVAAYNKETNKALDTNADYQPYALASTVAQLANQPLAVNGNNIAVRPALEVITWKPGESLTISSEITLTLQGLDFDFSTPNIAPDFTLEVAHKGEWQKVSLLHYKAEDSVVHTGNELAGMKADAIRLTNSSDKTLTLRLKRFALVKR